QILSWVGDNTSSNDTQNTALGENPNNSFDTVNRVRCFNHTLNLAVKAFLKPFDLPEKKKKPVNDAASTHSSDSDNDNDDLNDFALEDEDDLPDLADALPRTDSTKRTTATIRPGTILMRRSGLNCSWPRIQSSRSSFVCVARSIILQLI
ncbi:hypothetical protein B0H10DRAFT_1811487, partial [Mycena sp. CBHHK59/15]